MNRTEWETEHQICLNEEKRLLKEKSRAKHSLIAYTAEKYIPAGLESKLNKAFRLAFAFVFEKGGTVIRKTLSEQDLKDEYRVNLFSADNGGEDTCGGFRQSVKEKQRSAAAVSTAEGLGLGALGIGIPDIPVFTASLLRSVYQTASVYGFDYRSDKEKIFILKLIRTALVQGKAFVDGNRELGLILTGKPVKEWELENEIELTAKALAERLLYQKFIQGIPVAGVLGGISDAEVMKEVNTYSAFLYHKRFLRDIRGTVKETGN